MNVMLWLNNILVVSPDTFQVELQDLDSEESTRNAKGDVNRDRIASDKRKLNCGWTELSQSNISRILTAIEPEFFPVKYWDPKDGLTTKTFYAGPKSQPMARMKDGEPVWSKLQINFIEK